ncbi:MAG: hypothetical protein RR243_13695 [Citrobacter sp.]
MTGLSCASFSVSSYVPFVLPLLAVMLAVPAVSVEFAVNGAPAVKLTFTACSLPVLLIFAVTATVYTH